MLSAGAGGCNYQPRQFAWRAGRMSCQRYRIIKEMGEEHVKAASRYLYLRDSVLQIAAHEEAFGLERLYDLCKLAFKLVQPYNIAVR